MGGTEFTLVLSGGGMKGLAHVGVLEALEERGLEPSLIVGSSIGALIAATWATGMPLREIVARARLVRRKDIFAVAHADMAFRRMHAPAVYRREPLDHLVSSLVGARTFRDLPRRILVNTVDLESGAQVLWGLPGLDDVPVADAVFASCALPGIFAPREIRGRTYVDGAVVENLPLRLAAAAGRGPIVAVNLNAVGPVEVVREEAGPAGFAATYIRGLEVVMQTQNLDRLQGVAQAAAGAGAAARGARADVRVRPGRRAGGRGPALHARGTRRARRAAAAAGARRAPAPHGARAGGARAVRGLRRLRAVGADGVPHGRDGEGGDGGPGASLVAGGHDLRVALSDAGHPRGAGRRRPARWSGPPSAPASGPPRATPSPRGPS